MSDTLVWQWNALVQSCVRAPMRSHLVFIAMLLGCGDSAPTPVVEDSPATERNAADRYSEAVERLAAQRNALAASLSGSADPGPVLARARITLVRAIADDLLPAWSGTPWSMQGTATSPGDAPIACGYFVSTILQDAGLDLNRVKFGQAAALRIQRATTPGEREVHRIFSISPAKLAERIAAMGDGLYIIGLDVHVGFVLVEGRDVWFVHSSYTGDRVVTKEPLATAKAIARSQSHGYFVSELFSTDASVRKWLANERYSLPPA